MTDFESTLDAIDEVAVHHCGHCDASLGAESPSTLFCDDICQEAFYAARSEALVGYREPSDLPQHVFNLVEESSPETTPICSLDAVWAYRMAMYGNAYNWVVTDEGPFTWTMGDCVSPVHFTVTVDTSQFERSLMDARAAADRLWPLEFTFGTATTPTVYLKIPTTVEPGPECSTEGVEFDFDFPTTALLAAEEPPPPIMAPRMELDIEAINRQFGGFETTQPGRARRRIDPRRSR